MPDAKTTASVLHAIPKTDTKRANRDYTTPEKLPRGLVARMATYLISLNLVLFYFLVKMWPGTAQLTDQSTVFLGWNRTLPVQLWIETRYLLIVVLCGAIGSYIHPATSFADFVGNRSLKRSWEIWYILRPFIGAALASVVYFVMRAGLISGGSGAAQMSVYGVAATAGMCGLFSRQATDKLQAVFEEAFRTKHAIKRDNPLVTEPVHTGKK